MSRFYRLSVGVGVVLAVVVASAQSQPTLPIRRTDGRAVVSLSQLQVTAPVSLYVGADGGATGCSVTAPCSTIQRACDLLPLDILDAVTITASADYVGTGCRKEGIRFGSHPGTDGGVVWGSLTISGTLANYAPADGGTGTYALLAVTNGSTSAGTLEAWRADAGWNTDQAANLLVGVIGGTGSGTDRLWPVKSNTGDTLTLQANGEIATHPAAASQVQLYQASGSSNINANLGQSVTNGGPEDTGQVTGAAAFELGMAACPLHNGAASDRCLTIQHFNVTGSSVTLLRGSGSGPIDTRENFFSATGTLHRTTSGRASPIAERNVVTAGTLFVARNLTFGADLGFAQFYNNLGTSSVTSGLSSGVANFIWSQSNYFPNAQIRVGSCWNCRVLDDTWGNLRVTGELDPSTSPYGMGNFNIDGSTFANGANQAYVLNIGGRMTVTIDRMGGGPKSTITTASGGHVAILDEGAALQLDPSTTYNGSGTADIAFNAAGVTIPIATVHASVPRAIMMYDGTRVYETGSGVAQLASAVLATASSVGQGVQHGSKTLSTGAGSVTFTNAFRNAPDCTCTTSDATNVAECSASTTTLTITGTGSNTVKWICVGDY